MFRFILLLFHSYFIACKHTSDVYPNFIISAVTPYRSSRFSVISGIIVRIVKNKSIFCLAKFMSYLLPRKNDTRNWSSERRYGWYILMSDLLRAMTYQFVLLDGAAVKSIRAIHLCAFRFHLVFHLIRCAHAQPMQPTTVEYRPPYLSHS